MIIGAVLALYLLGRSHKGSRQVMQRNGRENWRGGREVHPALNDEILGSMLSLLIRVYWYDVEGAVMGEEQLLNGRRWLCTTAGSLCIVSCIVSLFTIAVIAFNRYLYVCWHDAYDTVFTRRRTLIAVVLTWLAGLALDSPNHFGWSSHKFDNKTQKCLWDRTTAYHYTVFFVGVGMLFPFLITITFYWRIFAYIQHAKQRILRTHFQARPDLTIISLMPRLHQDTCTCNMCPARATCIRIHICRWIHVAGYKLLVRDTCWLYLCDIITIHLCHDRLVSLCIKQQTGDKLATVLLPIQRNMLTATSGYNWIQLVSGNMCPGVNAA